MYSTSSESEMETLKIQKDPTLTSRDEAVCKIKTYWMELQ